MMSCYFIVSVKINDENNRTLYDEYIEKVKPIVESFGGEYIVRSEMIDTLSANWQPDRIIIIKFSSRELLDECFASKAYREIMNLRVQSVEANAIIVNGL